MSQLALRSQVPTQLEFIAYLGLLETDYSDPGPVPQPGLSGLQRFSS